MFTQPARLPISSRFERLFWPPWIVLACLLVGSPEARAGRMTYRFSGMVVHQEGLDGVSEGQSIEGMLSFNTDLERQDPVPDDPMTYYTGDITLSFRAGPLQFEIPVPFSSAVFVQNGGGASGEVPGDNLGFVIGSDPTRTEPGVPLLLSLGLIDETGEALDDDGPPLSIDFAQFSAGVVLAFDGDRSVSGVIETFEVVSIPEPAPGALFFAGFVWLAGRWRRKWNRTDADALEPHPT